MRGTNRTVHLVRHTGRQPGGLAAAGFGNRNIKGRVGAVAPGCQSRHVRRRHMTGQRRQHVNELDLAHFTAALRRHAAFGWPSPADLHVTAEGHWLTIFIVETQSLRTAVVIYQHTRT